jgi:hypothetical protein
MNNLFLTWLPYFLLGLVGILFHIWTKPTPDVTFWNYVKSHKADVLFAVLSYFVLLFFWIDSGIEFFGMVKNVPSGLTFMLGYFSQSVLGHLIKQFQNKLQ